jgi:hypothetical protein
MLARLAIAASIASISVTATATAAPLPVFGGCTSRVGVRPASIVMACADGNFYVTRIRWTRWTARTAAGTGTGHLNDCRPNCAAGHFHTYRVAITLSHPLVCAGLNEFSRVGWRYVAAAASGASRAGSESFSCRWRRVRPKA